MTDAEFESWMTCCDPPPVPLRRLQPLPRKITMFETVIAFLSMLGLIMLATIVGVLLLPAKIARWVWRGAKGRVL